MVIAALFSVVAVPELFKRSLGRAVHGLVGMADSLAPAVLISTRQTCEFPVLQDERRLTADSACAITLHALRIWSDSVAVRFPSWPLPAVVEQAHVYMDSVVNSGWIVELQISGHPRNGVVSFLGSGARVSVVHRPMR